MLQRDDIIAILQDYKRLVATKKELECDYELIKVSNPDVAICASGKSDGISAAIQQRETEIKHVDILIKRVDNWLDYLTTREAYVLREKYINGRTREAYRQSYYLKTKYFYSFLTWDKIRKKALDKLINLSKKQIPNY